MKHLKKKKRSRSSKQARVKDGPCDGDKEEHMLLKNLMEAFDSVSLEEAASAYREANGDPNKAAMILQGLAGNALDQTVSSRSSGSSGCGSSSCSSDVFASSGCSSSSCSSDVFVEADCIQNSLHGKGIRLTKPKKVIAATGTVSTVLGKEYVRSSPRRDLAKSKGWSNRPIIKEDSEQFLCSMLGDESELSMAVVKDVLCQCGYDVEKATNALLELSTSSYKQSKNGQSCGHSANVKEDRRYLLECSDNLIDEASDSTNHSSESVLQDNMWSMGYRCRNYSEVLAGSQVHSPTSPRASESELPQKVLESLFNMPKSSEHEPSNMNWRNVVKKIESLGQRFESCPSGTAKPQQHSRAKGDDYQLFRTAANQHWDSMKTYYQKAATAYSNGEREYAAYLSEQGRLCNKMAREADEKASQKIFEARNKSIENVITIDLHGQHVKQAIQLLKLHLLFGAYVRSVQSFRVITGCGSHGVGKSKLKQSVINLIEREGIEWSEENQGTVLIRLHGHTNFSFLDSESDNE